MKTAIKRLSALAALALVLSPASAIQNVYKCYATSSGSYNCEVVGTRG